ncbi:MAG: hypothetical protein CVT66_03560 [Actinobacteria bacterium HGW-Actinobacteria-6]|jgi:hypothetical protein|nr:MAG: hypothetical protein CVT66_03560 [Actinobacteria bacterium HGW-Actinobacteria-6]
MPPTESETFQLLALLPAPYYCAGCAERVCAQASGIGGVIEATCMAEEGSLAVTFDPLAISSERLGERVRELALEVTGAVGHAVYRLTGLD